MPAPDCIDHGAGIRHGLEAIFRQAARACIVLAALLWSTNGLFVKSHVFDDWSQDVRGTLLAFWRAFFAGMLLLPAVRRPRCDWRLVPMALAFTAMNVTFLQSMTLTTAANAIWLQSTAPLWVFFFSLTLYRDVHDRATWCRWCADWRAAAVILSFELAR